MSSAPAIIERFAHKDFIAERIDDGMEWAKGTIVLLPEHDNAASRLSIVRQVLDHIQAVSDVQQGMSACTDGRFPLRLLDGGTIPVRKQLAGGNLVSAFYIAESLAERFYANPQASLQDRISEVARFMAANNKTPSGHVNCGAAQGFGCVAANVPHFVKSSKGAFVARLQFFLPAGVYDADLHASMMRTMMQRATRNEYADLTPQMFLAAIEQVGGKSAIAELRDDGRGVSGHVEEAIIRLRVGNRALNGRALALATDGREVFGVNDDELDELATIFGRGQEENYRIARMAIEDFTNSGHATLSRQLPTWRVMLRDEHLQK